MLQVFQSNRLEALVTVLSAQLKQASNDSPLASDVVLVQSPGMSQWLKLQIAEQNGIAANIDFPLPSSFIWSLYQKFLANIPEQSPYNKDKLSWRIFSLLPDLLQHEAYEQIRDYLNWQSDNEETNSNSAEILELRRYQLATKIADVFDNYLMYRQEWLQHWETGANDLPNSVFKDQIYNQSWQPHLWRELVANVNSGLELEITQVASRAQMQQALLDLFQRATETDKQRIRNQLPGQIYVFGISTIPEPQLQILQALSNIIDVDIYWFNPCAVFWGDLVSEKTMARLASKYENFESLYKANVTEKGNYFHTGNPLLAAWGKVGRDYLDLLINREVNFTDIFIENTETTTLSMLQQDILNLQFRNSQLPLEPKHLASNHGKRFVHSDDDSVLVHNCHSRVRELEVLKDKLLYWFEQEPALKPKDILVMVPDIDQYAPYIASVFGYNVNDDSSFIPYTVADRAGLREDPLLNTFISLLQLPSSRFLLSEILDHLEVPAVLDKFNLTEAELELIKIWLNDCQVKWAKNSQHKAQWGLPETELNTWLYGLKRMLLGVAQTGDELWAEVLSYQHIEGLNAITLGKLVSYFSFLVQLEKSFAKDLSLQDWQQKIDALVDYLFAEHNSSVTDLMTIKRLKQASEKLAEYQLLDGVNKQINFRIVSDFFKQELGSTGVTQRFMAGSMNFCTLMPMRSVPFKVICVLGLNEGDYPRQVDPISFDLVALNTARKGDRSRKADERYLFLEALNSARQKLHLSFIGQSAKTNESLVPSVILSELIEYCQQSFLVTSETNIAGQLFDIQNNESSLHDNAVNILTHLQIQHKLQPYNEEYFSGNYPMAHYVNKSDLWFQIAKLNKNKPSLIPNETQMIEEETDNLGSELNKIDLSELVYFFVNPVRYYFKNVLGVRLDLKQDELLDHESFAHDGLTKYQITQQIFAEKTAKVTTSSSENIKRHLKTGRYPSFKWGEALFNQYDRKTDQIIDVLNKVLPTDLSESHQAIDIVIDDGINLEGEIKGFSHSDSFYTCNMRAGDVRPQDKLALYLTHLAKCANGNTGYSIIIDQKGKLQWFEPLANFEAKELLIEWCNTFILNKNRLFKWHINLAIKQYEGMQKGLGQAAIKQTLSAELVPNAFLRNLANDDYVLKVITKVDDLPADFVTISRKLVMPMLEQLKVQSGKKLPIFDDTELEAGE